MMEKEEEKDNYDNDNYNNNNDDNDKTTVIHTYIKINNSYPYNKVTISIFYKH
jgi:hypothetical protein